MHRSSSLEKDRDRLNAVLEKFPKARRESVYLPGFGMHRGITSSNLIPTGLYAQVSEDGEPMLTACDTVEFEGSNIAVFDMERPFVPWLPALVALKKINRDAYDCLLKIVISMAEHASRTTSSMSPMAIEVYLSRLTAEEQIIVKEFLDQTCK